MVPVPQVLQPQVIQAYHSSKRNTHYGDVKTVAQLREKYTWGSAFSDVRKFVLQCEIILCQRFGGPGPSKAQRQWSLHSDIPGEHWVMNIVHNNLIDPPDAERSPCCPEQSACPYGDKARLHGGIVKHVLQALQAGYTRGFRYHFGI